uniref:Uncharacterized protein n=1 Tax=Arundo donax TaxID=35708 RepID=A0A0A9G1T9_ARUDO
MAATRGGIRLRRRRGRTAPGTLCGNGGPRSSARWCSRGPWTKSSTTTCSVHDSKSRGCFLDAFVDKDLEEAVTFVTKPKQWKRREQVLRGSAVSSYLLILLERCPTLTLVPKTPWSEEQNIG